MHHIDLTDDWQGPFVLGTDEVWQCDSGIAEIATGNPPAPGYGVKLLGDRLDPPRLSAGLRVFCRGVDGKARIIRMPV